MIDERFDLMMELLEKSFEKNGDKTLTIKHLLNIMKLVETKYTELENEIFE